MKLKDIVYAAMNEDVSTVSNIFASELSEKIAIKLEDRKRLIQNTLYEFNMAGLNLDKKWNDQSAISKFILGGLAVGAALTVAKQAFMIPSAIRGMKDARRFGKIGPNLTVIKKWFPSAKPGDTVMLAFESPGEGGMPTWTHIKQEQIAIVLAALGSKSAQPNEKEMIVKSIDLTKSAFDQITKISITILERDKDFQKLAAHQDSQNENFKLQESGKGTDWGQWGQSAGQIADVGITAASEITQIAQSKLERLKAKEEKEKAEEEGKEVERQDHLTGLINQLSDSEITPLEREKLENELRDVSGTKDYNAQLALQQSKSAVRSSAIEKRQDHITGLINQLSDSGITPKEREKLENELRDVAGTKDHNAQLALQQSKSTARSSAIEKSDNKAKHHSDIVMDNNGRYSFAAKEKSVEWLKTYIGSEDGKRNFNAIAAIREWENVEAPIAATVKSIYTHADERFGTGRAPTTLPDGIKNAPKDSSGYGNGSWLPIQSQRKDVATGYMNRAATKMFKAWLDSSPGNIENFKQGFGDITKLGHLLRAAIAAYRGKKIDYRPALLNTRFENTDDW